MKKIKYTKNGQPYIIKSDGRAQFIKAKSRKATHKRKRGLKMAKRKNYSRKSSSYGLIGTIGASMAYGAFRGKLSNAMQPLTNNIPLGNISDEVALGIVAIVAKKYLGRKMPMIAKVADSALMIESARIGEAIISGSVGGMASPSGNTNVVNY